MSNEINVRILLKWKNLHYNCSFRVFIFWNRFIMTSLSILSKICFSIYIIKLLFIHLSLILFRNLPLTIYMTKKTLFIVVVATGRSNDNLISIYTNENIKFFFVFIIFSARLAIPSIPKNSLSLCRSIIYVSNWSPSTMRSTIDNSLA